MANRYEVIEERTRTQNGSEMTTRSVLGSFDDIECAKRCLRESFDALWEEHEFPSDLWVDTCRPPEESPCDVILSSKFPDVGAYRIVIC